MTHTQSLVASSYLSKLPLLGREQKEDVMRLVPEDVIPVVQDAGIDFVLVGAHGIGGWLPQARATNDVDFLVRVRDKQKAADAVIRKYPELQIEKFPDVWRLKQGEECLIDLMLTRAPLYKRVIDEFHEVRLGKRKVKMPKLEAALAMKFAAMTGHYRNVDKKYYDAGDFAGMVRKNAKIDLTLLSELGDLVFPGGGAAVTEYVRDIRAGKPMKV